MRNNNTIIKSFYWKKMIKNRRRHFKSSYHRTIVRLLASRNSNGPSLNFKNYSKSQGWMQKCNSTNLCNFVSVFLQKRWHSPLYFQRFSDLSIFVPKWHYKPFNVSRKCAWGTCWCPTVTLFHKLFT
jgi:hypothetical protein